jgi:tetratricopeptide (TPR) repeat protein
MTNPGPDIELRIRRIEHGLEQVGSLLVPVEISDGVKKAITLSNIDPDMALGRARKVLEFIISDLYRREFGRSPGTQPLENTLQQLSKAGKLPRTMQAYANNVRELGNVGIHGSGEAISADDVVSSLENLMRLVAWYCEQVRPGGSEDKPEPPIDDDRQAEKEKAEREKAEKDRLEKEQLEKDRLEQERVGKERLERERLEKEQLEKERAEKERAEIVEREKERLEKERIAKTEKERLERERLEKEKARLEQERLEQERRRKGQFREQPPPRRGKLVVLAFLLCVAGGALWWWFAASPSAKHREFLKHKYDGIALLNSGQYDKAELELLSAYAMDNRDDYVYYCLGETQSHLGQWKYAIDYYQHSLKLKPDASYTQVALANALLQSGDVDGAIAEYKIITSTNYNPPLDPTTSAWVHQNYSTALLKKGDFNGSVRQSVLSMEADPNWRSKLGDRIYLPPPRAH